MERLQPHPTVLVLCSFTTHTECYRGKTLQGHSALRVRDALVAWGSNITNSMEIEKKIVVRVIIGLVVVVLLFSSFGTIGAGERGVLTRFGAVTGKVYDEGLYFKLPFIEKVVKMNVQTQRNDANASSASKDLQSVSAVLAVNYHLEPTGVAGVYREYRQEYVTRLVEPSVQESVKGATAQFTAEELITKRAEVRDAITANIKQKVEAEGVIIDDVNIVNFNFSSSFNEAIEAKVTAEQDALAAKNKLEQIKYEAQQKIEEAKGKAEAMRIESIALQSNPALLELRAIEKWDGVLPTVTGGATPFINVNK